MSEPSTSSSSGVSTSLSPRPRAGSGLLIVVGAISIVVAVATIAVNAMVGYEAQRLLTGYRAAVDDAAARQEADRQRPKPEPVQPNQLTPEQVDALAKAAQDAGANPAHLQSLRRVLSAPDQRAIRQSATTQEAVSQVRRVQILPGGMLMLVGPAGGVVIAADGTVHSDGKPSTAPAGAADGPAASAGGQAALPTARLLLLDAGVSLVLSLFLLIAGVAALARSGRGAGMHRAYALLQIVASVAVAAIWIRGDYPPFVAAGTRGDLLGQWSANLALVLLVACLYPLLLLLVFGAFGRRPPGTAAGA